MENVKQNDTDTSMANFQKEIVEKLVNMVKAIPGSQCRVILGDGTSYGELEVKEPKKHKPKSTNGAGHRYARGETLAYYRPFLDTVKCAGGVVFVPFDRFHPPTLAQNVNSYAHAMWGTGNYNAVRDDALGVVKVARLK
jgi:hypothetical protein